MNEAALPQAAVEGPNSVEILRVWVAGGELHCSLKIGMYRDGMGIEEEFAWGTILSDAARHIARALQKDAPQLERESPAKIVAHFNAEVSSPTPEIKGGFV